MSWVTLSMRKGELKARIARMRQELLKKSEELMELQHYGSNIADGIITFDEIANTPSSFMERQHRFMAFSIPFAFNQAMQKTQMMQSGLLPGMSMFADPSQLTQEQIQIFMMGRFRAELENMSRVEEKNIQLEEKKLTQEKIQIETQLKAMEAELQQVEQAEGQAIKSEAIKLA